MLNSLENYKTLTYITSFTGEAIHAITISHHIAHSIDTVRTIANTCQKERCESESNSEIYKKCELYKVICYEIQRILTIKSLIINFDPKKKQRYAYWVYSKNTKNLLLRISHFSPVKPGIQTQYPIALHIPLMQFELLQIPKTKEVGNKKDVHRM